ncbi:ARM repeat superfamily protein [Carex rostrata]
MSGGGGSSWRSLLLRIGDKCAEYGGSSDYRDHIDTCYSALGRDFESSKDAIFELILQCAEQLPHKAPFYAVLVGLINLENEDFAKRVVDATHSALQDALQAGNCDRIRISLRFLTALMSSKVIAPSSIIEAFETLLSSAATTIDEETGNPSYQPCADFYVYCILASLPWGGTELVEQVPDELERVMVMLQSYLSIRARCNDNSFSVFETDEGTSPAEKDFVEDLWERIQLLSQNGWKAVSVPQPHLPFEAQLVAGQSHSLSPINCPLQLLSSPSNPKNSRGQERHEAMLKFPQRLCRLSIFPSNKNEIMRPIDRFVVEEYLLDVLLFFNGCRKECAFYLAGLPVPFRYEYIMAETIFSQLLLLPQPPFKPMYYTLVILDLCKALPGAFPAVVVGAVRALFDKITNMDMECRSRLILWFSHHLSNCQYIWPWQDWAYVRDLPRWAPQRVFVQEVLERETRLSYWDKIKQSIEDAPALEELLPPKGGPDFKYTTTDKNLELTNGHRLSRELNGLVRTRKTQREISSWVEEYITKEHGPKFALEVVAQTLLDIGSKSFTHLITVLERYGQVIGKVCSNEDLEVELMNEVVSYWKNSTQMTAVAIDRMMGYRLVSNWAIVKWVFSSVNVDLFHVSDRPWEILRNAVNKTCNRIADLRKEIATLEKAVHAAEELSLRAEKDYEEAKLICDATDGKEPGQSPARVKRLELLVEKARKDEATARESLETKKVSLSGARDESKSLFTLLFKSFADVLNERLPAVSPDEEMPNLRSRNAKLNANEIRVEVDLEVPASMDVDQENENGESNDSETNGEEKRQGYNIGEQEQWCLVTLGYLKAFSRQYATEIWPHIETLDSEIFTEDVHPLTKKAAFSGLSRPSNEW